MEQQHQWEPKKSPREVYGDPEPSGKTVVVSDNDRQRAAALLAVANEMIISYVRPNGKNAHFTYHDTGKDANQVAFWLTNSEPVGVVLAFKEGENVYVGWSRRNEQRELDETAIARYAQEIIDLYSTHPGVQGGLFINNDEGVSEEDARLVIEAVAADLLPMKEIEPLPFSKADARRVAVLRALTDDVVQKGDRYFTRDGDRLPDDIQEPMRKVVHRAKKYFRTDKIRNLVPHMMTI